MINKISRIDGLKTRLKTPTEKANNKLTTQVIRNTSVANYSLNNLQANYLPVKTNTAVSFTGAEAPAETAASTTPTKIKKIITISDVDKSFEKLTEIPFHRLLKGEFYNESADNLSIMIGPARNNALLVMEDGVNPDILMHNFINNIYSGKYDGQELYSQDTDILLLDPQRCLKNDVNPVDSLIQMSFFNSFKFDKGEKKIVFVKDFDFFTEILNMGGVKDVNSFLKDQAPNLSIVGLLPKKSLKPALDSIDKHKMDLNVDSLDSMKKLELKGLSSTDTKEFIKKNSKFSQSIFARYKDKKIKISYNAIDEIVDKSAIHVEGAFPKKALDILEGVVASKLNETKSESKLISINSSDVNRFFTNHIEVAKMPGNVMEFLVPSKGQFNIAENVTTKLSDVGGIGTARQEIEDDIIAYLKNPKKFIAERGKAPKGALLKGGPGTGKTLLARAIAGETNTPFIAASGSEFVEKYVGVGAQRVRDLFKRAKEAAENSPNKTAVVFIDEIDAIGRVRSAGVSNSNDEREATLNQLLTEMDGFNNKESKVKIIVLAATNRDDILDPALKRAGRFDSIIEIPNARTITDRLEILNIHAKKLNFKDEVEKEKILNEAAIITDDMSGAELADVMTKAAKVVSKRADNKFITHNDVVEGFLQVLAGPIKQNDQPIEEIRNTVRHEGGHAVVVDTLKKDKVSFITLDSRGRFLGAVFHNPIKRLSPDFKSVIISAATSYAGGIAEPDFKTSGHAAGVSQDLKNATNLNMKAITKWGLGVYTPHISIDTEGTNGVVDPLLRVNEGNIQKDNLLFSSIEEKIGKMIVDFHQDFLDDYVKRYEENAGKGGNNLSGEEFSKLRQNWLKETGKVEAEKRLYNKAMMMIDSARYRNKSFVTRIAKKIARVV